ncbi:hypothetical protein FGIG_05511 [Fasciola gigantica]|uniref:Uncharacterized protein n=1 Tax=Fasciola gigantica TaxID=46835 RepID=A0A504ZAN5_FASGI|nr:hypothetical protein FGIG_05511 [Fasciola gigantica]
MHVSLLEALKYNLQIAIALPEYTQPSGEDVLQYCWNNDINISQSITDFLKIHMGIRVTFMSFLVRGCDHVSRTHQFYPSELLIAFAHARMYVQTENSSSTACEGVTSSAQSILIGEYINSQLTKQSSIHVNRLPEVNRRPKENLIGRYKRETSTNAVPRTRLVFRIRANLNESWNTDYRNCSSSRFRATARRFCLLHRAALRRLTKNNNLWTNCTVTDFLPIPVQFTQNSSQSSHFVRVSADFRTNCSQLFVATSEQTTVIMNRAFRLIENDTGFNIILPTQVVRTDHFLTCSKDASICSPFANCAQTNRGFDCVCSSLFKDTYPEVPGTKCQLDIQAVVIITTIVCVVVFCLILTVFAATIRQNQNVILLTDEG